MAPKISIIVSTYTNINGFKYLLKYFENKGYEVIFVDNMPDKDKPYLVHKVRKVYKNHRGEVMYLPQKKNLGFAAAINHAMRYVKTPWILILNDDVEFDKVDGPIEKLVKYAKRNKLAAAAPLLQNSDGSIENYGYRILPYGRIELVRKDDKSGGIDGLTAACLLVDTKMFRKLKGFDEKFFAYLEDVDLFLRLKKMTSTVNFNVAEEVVVYHHHMKTSDRMGTLKSRLNMINWWRVFFKHPDKIKFSLKFLVERIRNVNGYLKASIKNM